MTTWWRLSTARRRTTAANGADQSEFLTNMPHELRTPLNRSLILSKLLAESARGNLQREQIEFALTIYAGRQ